MKELRFKVALFQQSNTFLDQYQFYFSSCTFQAHIFCLFRTFYQMCKNTTAFPFALFDGKFSLTQ